MCVIHFQKINHFCFTPIIEKCFKCFHFGCLKVSYFPIEIFRNISLCRPKFFAHVFSLRRKCECGKIVFQSLPSQEKQLGRIGCKIELPRNSDGREVGRRVNLHQRLRQFVNLRRLRECTMQSRFSDLHLSLITLTLKDAGIWEVFFQRNQVCLIKFSFKWRSKYFK